MALGALRLVPCGDRALLCYLGEELDEATSRLVHSLAEALRGAHPAIVEVTPGFHALMVEYDPVRIRLDHLTAMVQEAAGRTSSAEVRERVVEIPVVYGGEYGPDLDAVAARAGLTPEEAAARHVAGAYRVYCLGFSPGFPYLGGLDPILATPRLDDPRVHVPDGSVGIGGNLTGIYPGDAPGGWRLIGRTPVRLFDPRREPPALLRPGDRVRFVPIDPAAYTEMEQREQADPPALPVFAPGRTGLRIVQPGWQTTLQDLGRRGYTAYGVSVAGAVDQQSLMIGNWLLGNRARTAALEITLTGPEIEFTGPIAFALTGAPISAELIPADGGSPRPVPGWTSVLAGPGDRLRLGAVTAGCRAYLCVAGGIDLPPVLGSLSEDLFGHIGPLGRPLRAGDWLPVGLPLHPPADLAGRSLPPDAIPPFEGQAVIRLVLGPQADQFSEEAISRLFAEGFRVGPRADRQGLRLEGPRLQPDAPAAMLSEPIPPGALQVVPSGQPILLLSNRQTLGGYPKIATAVFTDLWRAAQLKEGDRVSFEQVDVAEGHAIAWQERRRLGQIRRYLERRTAAVFRPSGAVQATLPPAAAAQVTPPTAPATAGAAAARPGARVYRITVGDTEFLCEVEEVLD